uniref:FAD-binding domain-containing protein n=1 Tax=Oryza meridionalis TaxID=40149 RepID=A0A0E0CVC4_9ORYZ
MEGSDVEGIVIAGAGLAGLATALGLHRKGVRSLVLESSATLRASGFAFTTWTNAFRALDALGVGDKIREHHLLYESGPHEIRCVKRYFLRETLENELPEGTIRFSSKIVSIEGRRQCEALTFGRWLNDKSKDGDAEESVAKMRSYVLAKLRAARIPAEALDVIERSEMSDVVSSPLRFRSPLALVRGSISRGNVCVAGDAFHPTTTELGQGGCAALEDGVVLARCLSEAFLADGAEHDPGYEAVTAALEKYAEERRWRGIRLITAAYVVGFIQQSTNPVIKFLREKFLSGLLAKTMITMADYDCGKL